jgi:hypothetical protein
MQMRILCITQRLINTRLQWNSNRITLDPDPSITKEFNMINVLNSKGCQNDLPLLTTKSCQIALKRSAWPEIWLSAVQSAIWVYSSDRAQFFAKAALFYISPLPSHSPFVIVGERAGCLSSQLHSWSMKWCWRGGILKSPASPAG